MIGYNYVSIYIISRVLGMIGYNYVSIYIISRV
ncbi:hypothetical protein KSS87_022747 [Heliosperma pusillum]|nr:hypothetical protein KSS87_022747 [Heliosperma pusillum]